MITATNGASSSLATEYTMAAFFLYSVPSTTTHLVLKLEKNNFFGTYIIKPGHTYSYTVEIATSKEFSNTVGRTTLPEIKI